MHMVLGKVKWVKLNSDPNDITKQSQRSGPWIFPKLGTGTEPGVFGAAAFERVRAVDRRQG